MGRTPYKQSSMDRPGKDNQTQSGGKRQLKTRLKKLIRINQENHTTGKGESI